ncbi:hypothetical protein [Arcticibacterium luteifluviistationis]|uniref:DUF4286 domain-containing protein n=1 Tax=Arcticibacterium luteifluviistationis TaxID=1784714 RepID=A0A2Z4G715_9BACT|nr:hypothetical protein [Arcticibacterium luteifluviistationis]AWV96966.1 hypothetical protein DJ013_01750 [Arcticibacterium luteifluviistationis]
MVLIHLLINNKDLLIQISEWLLKENLAVSVEVDYTREHFIIENDKVVKETVHKLSFISKASEFSSIHKALEARCGDALKEIYSVPVVYQNWNPN